MYYLEDIVIGAKRETGRHTFAADEIKTFAKAYDPQRFHVDEKEAENSHFGALCASGWHTAAFCMRFLVEDRKRMVAEAKAAGVKIAQWGPSPGVRELKWIKPVYVGDTITYHTEALETRPSGSRPGWGLLTVRHTGTNQHGDIVYSVIGSAFVERRPGA